MNQRPLFERIAAIALLLCIGYATADLLMLSQVRPMLLPSEDPPPLPAPRSAQTKLTDLRRYNVITEQNIFSPDQVIPDPLGGALNPMRMGEPVLTTRPITLLGTLVHNNESRSVALVKAGSDTVAVRIDGKFDGNGATMKKIERSRIIFINESNQQLEYAAISEKSNLKIQTVGAPTAPAGGITVKSDLDREVSKSMVESALKNLPNLLQEARAVPRIGANGQVECWQIAEMRQGSLFETLGVRRGDCIETVNGDRIDSAAKAMEIFNALRNSATAINLGIERGGRKESMNFTITQ